MFLLQPIAVLLLVTSVALAFVGLQHLQNKFVLNSTRTCKIRDLTTGMVEVHGTSRKCEETLTAPFSEKECFCFEIVIEEYVKGGEEEGWKVADVARLGVPFFVEDDTGSTLVDPEGANLETPDSFFTEHHQSRVPPEDLQDVKNRLKEIFPGAENRFNLNMFRHQYGRDLRFSEDIVQPGDQVWVLGRAMEAHRGRNARYPDDEDCVIHTGSTTPEFTISDLRPKDHLPDHYNYIPWFTGAGLCLATGFAALVVA